MTGEVEKRTTWGDKRGYSWPAFTDGNTVAMTHGAQSPRVVRPLAEQIRDHYLEVAPHLRSPLFASAVDSFAWHQAQVLLLREWVNEHGLLDGEGERLSAVDQLGRLEGRLERARMRLGLDVIALGDVMSKAASVAQATGDEAALDALAEEGRRILAARDAPAELNPGGEQTDDDEVEP